MAAYAIRGDKPLTQEVQLTPVSEYKNLNPKQFTQFARIYLKDKIIGDASRYSSWRSNLSSADMQRMNDFFENIPDYIIDFSSEASIKLLMMYITTNLEYGFGCKLSEDEAEFLSSCMSRLREVDPRI